VLDQFCERFAPSGFRREAFYPCYGLAESTLLVSGGTSGRDPVIETVDPAALERRRFERGPGRALVGCGHTRLGQTVEIVDPETRERCPPGHIGELWLHGPSVAKGYWQRPRDSEQTFGAVLADAARDPRGPGVGVVHTTDDNPQRFLRTGDLGVVHRGELFVTGRINDIIIIRGRNHYPQDIEATVQRSHVALRADCGAAVAVEIDGEERLVVVQEVERAYLRQLDRAEVIGRVREAVTSQHDVSVHQIVLLMTGGIPRTSSGKVQRRACAAAFLDGRLPVIPPEITAP
jgi:acyl-CoA synthetase (AMP-forming)/AMP-acid ligase II